MPTWLALLLGLLLLAAGGEFLVRGTVGLARKLGISPLLAGLTIVGFGTSAPELVTSLRAALTGSPDIAVGNVIGSNIANILLILGASALVIAIPITRPAFRRDGLVLALSALAAVGAVLAGGVSRAIGVGLFAALVAYIVYAYFSEKNAASDSVTEQVDAAVAAPQNAFLLGGITLAGIGGVIFGARFLVEGAVELATQMGVSQAVIGLSVVAIGTSLPELVACLAAALKKEPDVALGNVVGSCIYNIFGILGLTAVVQPLGVPPEIAALDIWVLAVTTALLLVFLRTGLTIQRWEGGVLLLSYAAYLAYLVTPA
ncbi:calcium/sodium antiporter [Sphingomicrobium astaxanthinifaciens]|uniref:calcium/sodium antiporter n=1 Tax=Sphingomicrobium astaxanthinifaciens TaxID=1227949 RepID=UPI001FCB3B25|nr:calcium/sodium antiporter [Sphingomicrobium astaxanthinifaciens]MCJ7420769.1 calcium/sodium antiporter [Sphingomicrobium astaxanthinifaciens]